ncbi:MAG: hypothetical protein QS721_05855 [Candidatus Endonucleobacter sp. (ex Gigantidas childressi)]|nr:hypothetical protein [Candidatus Endonucleobacter sp. (ex Gigantidas childressi)]
MKLDKKNADAICTAVVVGYAKDLGRATFEYDKTSALGVYTDVQKKFSALGVNIDISLSTSKSKVPVIAGKGATAWSTDLLKDMGDIEFALARSIERRIVLEGHKDLFGAYIGGLSQVSDIRLVGASDLDMYQPKYRDVDSSAVSKSYKTAVNVSHTINDVLKNNQFKNVKFEPEALQYPDYQPGKLFKSYHGMIKAMVKYQNDSGKNSFFFEIAAGGDTNKISSCLPCATFMHSAGRPATSIHLGRGDNWNIPQTSSGSDPMVKKSWALNINKWYADGAAIMAKKNILIDKIDGMSADKAYEIFLESLSFERSFTDRIIGTLAKV